MRRNLFWLSDEQWARIEPHLPTDVRGVERVDDRRVISGIVHVLKSGCRWCDCPPEYGPHMTIYNRLLTGGEAHDCPVATDPQSEATETNARRRQGYDSAELREDLDEHGTKPVIPNRCNRKQPFSFSKRLYKLCWRIESAFNRLKDFRRIATRYDRLARNYLASVCLVAALVWWI